ncbi:MAG: DUF2171 domain-containing protein, partial [Terriglobales bacterium]
MAEPKVLLSRDQIARRVAEMGAEITRDFTGQPVVLVAVLKGATIFLSDLARNIHLEAHFDFFGISSYRDRTHSTGEVKLTKDDRDAGGEPHFIPLGWVIHVEMKVHLKQSGA